MIVAADGPPAVAGRGLRKTFRRKGGRGLGDGLVTALDDISFVVPPGALVALVGPDGAGKTTLIRAIAGLIACDAGTLTVMGIDVATDSQAVQDRIAYMPQRFGLYEDLSVQENLDLYADLHGVTGAIRAALYPRLLGMTALAPFTRRLAGRLSGGMKQKLGLACTLVSTPSLLLLDEPTVGVDPLSRRELWEIIVRLVRDQGLTVLLSTAYLDEAERCDQVFVLHEGRILAEGPPSAVTGRAADRTFQAEPAPGQAARILQSRLLDDPRIVDAVPEAGQVRFVISDVIPDPAPDVIPAIATTVATTVATSPLAGVSITAVAPRFEDGFMVLLRQQDAVPETPTPANPARDRSDLLVESVPSGDDPGPMMIEVHDLVRKFGVFTAVDHVSFAVARGTIFGLLGPNGAGKTTTFRMLCGLLSATAGTLRVAGLDVRAVRAAARQHFGYVAQKFSLYGQLSVAENLDFFASAYGLQGRRKRERIDWALHHFELRSLMHLASGQLPGGFKQRLAMAVALLHEPEILFLDEPTSGADPRARRAFWQRITGLAAAGVTVVVTTHFMEEAEYCDHVAILDAGRILAAGTPASVRAQAPADGRGAATMDDAFVAIVEQARARERAAGGTS
ncbi:MAG: ATP-binding cassette domain-containing protein [Azospirillaceae bacterium]|nr:ATP-binding cassette domain-containing protein [Azospirillaceae bacterium]